MKLTKFAAAVAVVGSMLAGAAHASPTINTPDGALSPFGGFDWASGAAAWTTGYTGALNSTFTLHYAAWAVSVNDTGSGTLFTPFLDTNANGLNIAPGAYEYTIYATLNEKITADFTTSQEFQVQSGAFEIWFGPAGQANANQLTGTGFRNGVKIIEGTVNASTDTFDNLTGGQANLTGTVTATNLLYVNPALVGTKLTSTLQLAASATNFTTPTGFDYDNNGTSDALGAEIIFQADSNQSFSVPEPGALLLVGGALAMLGATTRRKKQA